MGTELVNKDLCTVQISFLLFCYSFNHRIEGIAFEIKGIVWFIRYYCCMIVRQKVLYKYCYSIFVLYVLSCLGVHLFEI